VNRENDRTIKESILPIQTSEKGIHPKAKWKEKTLRNTQSQR